MSSQSNSSALPVVGMTISESNGDDHHLDKQLKDEILKQVKLLEEEHEITILLVTDVGSRAYNWENPTKSDYDLNFIYTRHWKYYMTIQNKPQTLKKETYIDLDSEYLIKRTKSSHDFYHDSKEGETTNEKIKVECNFVGFDIKYAAEFFFKSNRAIVFLLTSPCVYYVHPKAHSFFFDKWIPMCHTHVQRRHHLQEMIHIARYNINRYILGRRVVRVKSYLYILHHLFYVLYLFKRKDGESFKKRLPPLEFKYLFEDLKGDFISPKLAGLVEFLMKLKVSGDNFCKIVIPPEDVKPITETKPEVAENSEDAPAKKKSKKQMKKEIRAQAEDNLKNMEDDGSKNDIHVGHSLEIELFTIYWYRKMNYWIYYMEKDCMDGNDVDKLLLEAIDMYEGPEFKL